MSNIIDRQNPDFWRRDGGRAPFTDDQKRAARDHYVRLARLLKEHNERIDKEKK